jgi:hypothetical protein
MQLTPELAVLALRMALVASLYAVLFWIAVVVSRGVRPHAREVTAAGAPARRLIVLEAPEAGLEPGLAIALQPRTTIGRASENLVVVADPVVSSRHAAISARGDRWWVEDLGSTNGTQVNDQWVSAPVPVGVGDEIQVGPARFRIAA